MDCTDEKFGFLIDFPWLYGAKDRNYHNNTITYLLFKDIEQALGTAVNDHRRSGIFDISHYVFIVYNHSHRRKQLTETVLSDMALTFSSIAQ